MTSTRLNLNLKSINCCITGIISKCSAGVTWAEHKVCMYAIKASYADRCMYYNAALEGHCDCLDAQKAPVKTNCSS